MTIGALLALHSLSEKIFDCIYVFGDNLEVIDDFQVVTKKINSLLQLKEENKENYFYDLNGKIIFSNVSIYVNNKVILKNINFSISPGEKVAIIGANGSGKSILAKTILGFYEYEGNIYINNHNIKGLNKEDIRKYVELILGESYMFSGSVLENIELNNNSNIEEIDKITEDCDLKEDIERFENGYDTLIGEKGTKLSGGQRQRICIARSLVNDKPILILDEALNKLDNKTRGNILTKLINTYDSKTMIFISNDLEIINYVDNIIYIDGITTVTGRHEDLIKNNMNYKNLMRINNDII
ncbi:MAG: ATP-binding cassette domain-containing protein [Clostridia bacterium]|nr:ATP-binding cassette domain-containing protein [Clostridia bacterium]